MTAALQKNEVWDNAVLELQSRLARMDRDQQATFEKMSVAERLAALVDLLRLSSGNQLSLRTVAGVIGVTPQSLSNWLSGKTKQISIDNARRLSEAFGLPIRIFTSHTGTHTGFPILPQDVESLLLDPESRQYVRETIELARICQETHCPPEVLADIQKVLIMVSLGADRRDPPSRRNA